MYYFSSKISSKIFHRFAISAGVLGILLISSQTAFAAGATLWVDPANKVVTIGDRVEARIMLDTNGSATDGIDIHYLKYNPQYLRVEDADLGTSGIQIKSGTLYPITKTNIVDTAKGLIDFSQITTGGTTFKGRGVLATVTFTVIGANSSDIIFDFTSGATRDTNVASAGKDILLATPLGSRFAFAYTKPIVPPPASTPASSPGAPPFPLPASGQALLRNLWRGIRHEQVKILQGFLIGRGYLSSDSLTGFFGPLTEAAIKRFQCDQKIVCGGTPASTGYGVIGPRTRKIMNQLSQSQTPTDRQQIIDQLQREIHILQQKIQELLRKK